MTIQAVFLIPEDGALERSAEPWTMEVDTDSGCDKCSAGPENPHRVGPHATPLPRNLHGARHHAFIFATGPYIICACSFATVLTFLPFNLVSSGLTRPSSPMAVQSRPHVSSVHSRKPLLKVDVKMFRPFLRIIV